MKLRRLIYNMMCKIGLHSMGALPTMDSDEDYLRFEVCCERCGKLSKDKELLLLVKILNKVQDLTQ